MLTLSSAVKVFLCTQPTDMRFGFDGLSGLVRSFMEQDPLSGHLFVFRGKRADKLKVLYWDRHGLALWYKHLQAGTFRFPKLTEQNSLEVDHATLMMILEGIDLQSIKRRKRFNLIKQIA